MNVTRFSTTINTFSYTGTSTAPPPTNLLSIVVVVLRVIFFEKPISSTHESKVATVFVDEMERERETYSAASVTHCLRDGTMVMSVVRAVYTEMVIETEDGKRERERVKGVYARSVLTIKFSCFFWSTAIMCVCVCVCVGRGETCTSFSAVKFWCIRRAPYEV